MKEKNTVVYRYLLLFFILLAAISQYFISSATHTVLSKWLLLIAAMGTAFCLRNNTYDKGYTNEHTERYVCCPSIWVRTISAISFGGGVFLLFTSSWHLTHQWHKYFFTALIPLGAGTLLTCFGIDYLVGFSVWRRPITPEEKRLQTLLFILLILTATFMRTYRIDYFPPPDGFVAVEEAQQGDRAYELLYKNYSPWEFLTSNYFTALSFRVFGMNSLTLRIPPVVLSIISVALLYWLLRIVVGFRIALFASFLFAASRWHLTYSRIAHNVFIPAALVFLCLYLLYKTTISTRPSLYILIGLVSGLLLYAYAPYRSMPLLVLIFYTDRAIRYIVHTKRSGTSPGLLMTTLKNIHKPVLIGLSVAILAVPLWGRIKSHPDHYFEAARRAIAKKTAPSWYDTSDMKRFICLRVERIKAIGRIFAVKGDISPTLNLPSEPMLDPVTGIMFVLGLCFCTLTPLRERHTFMVIGVYLAMIMGGLFPHNFDVRRLITLIPIIYVIIALFTSGLRSFFNPPKRRVTWFLFHVVMIAIVFICTILNCNLFFNKQIESPRVRRAYKNEYTAMSTLIRNKPDNMFFIIASQSIDNFFLTTIYRWYGGPDKQGTVVRNPQFISALARLANFKSDVCVMIPDRYGNTFQGLSGTLHQEFPLATEESYTQDLSNGNWTWSVVTIPRGSISPPEDNLQILEGFAKIIDGGKYVKIRDFAGASPYWKITGENQLLTWLTEPPQLQLPAEFLFIGKVKNAIPSASLKLSVDQAPIFSLPVADLSYPSQFEKEGYELQIIPFIGRHAKGFFCKLQVPAKDITPGTPLSLSLKMTNGGDSSWFALRGVANAWDFTKHSW